MFRKLRNKLIEYLIRKLIPAKGTIIILSEHLSPYQIQDLQAYTVYLEKTAEKFNKEQRDKMH